MVPLLGLWPWGVSNLTLFGQSTFATVSRHSIVIWFVIESYLIILSPNIQYKCSQKKYILTICYPESPLKCFLISWPRPAWGVMVPKVRKWVWLVAVCTVPQPCTQPCHLVEGRQPKCLNCYGNQVWIAKNVKSQKFDLEERGHLGSQKRVLPGCLNCSFWIAPSVWIACLNYEKEIFPRSNNLTNAVILGSKSDFPIFSWKKCRNCFGYTYSLNCSVALVLPPLQFGQLVFVCEYLCVRGASGAPEPS